MTFGAINSNNNSFDNDSNVISDSSSSSNNLSDTLEGSSEDRIVESIYQHIMESMCRDVACNMHWLIKTGANDMIPSSWKLFSGTRAPTRRELYPELYNGASTSPAGDDGGEGDEGNHDSSESSPFRTSDEEIQKLLEKYAVDLPSSSPTARRRRTRDIAEEEEKRRLLSKIQKEKESNYKDSDDEVDEDENMNDDEDDDDEDFKMEDAEGDDDEMNGSSNKTKKGRSMSSSSMTPSSDEQVPPAGAAPSSMNPPAPTDSANTNRPKLDIWGKNPAKEPKNRLCQCPICGRLVSTSRFASHLDKCMGLSMSRGGPSSKSSASMMMSGKSTMDYSLGIGRSGGTVMKKSKRGSTVTK